MSYTVNIPEDLRPTIIKYVNEAPARMQWNEKQLDFLLTVYYRYVEQLGRFKSVAEKVKVKRRCGDCRNTMLEYFEHQADIWEGKNWEE